jgi:hypothetical protein
MSAFDDLQQALGAARAEVDARERAVVDAHERLHRLRRDRDLAARGGSTEHLDQAIGEQEESLGRLRVEADGLRARERGLLVEFADFSDPSKNLGRLTDRIPICLFPLRIEYRFKRAGEPGPVPPVDPNDPDPRREPAPLASDELWVRVYPDDISVDSFEPTLTVTEARDARSYWASVWSAGGDEAGLRGAWKVLVAGQGAGRSFFVTQTYAPLNPGDQPAPPATGPWVILAVTTQAPLAEPELTALRTYWTDVWRAGDDLTALQTADQDLEAAVGAARAEELRQAYRPRNLAVGPPGAATRDETDVTVAFLHFPTDDAAQVRLHGWATTPRARLLPDRLVLMGLRAGQQVLHAVGEPVPPTLAVAPDPSAAEEDQLRPDGTGLFVGPELEWVTDFTRAVEQGMGFRIPLGPADVERGFDEVIVLGVRLRSDPEASRVALEELIDHHHHSKSGFSVLPQGRPTNNADGDRSAYRWIEDSDVSFDHYFGTPPPDPADWYAKRDGRWLAEMLGLDPATLDTVPFYGRSDIADAKAMNVALWPGTLGYFLESMLHPIVEDDTLERTREFFVRHVSARGTLPAVRVGRQPYGILPATARSRLRWFARRPGSELEADGPFLQRLYGHLRTMEADVTPLLQQVSYVGKPGADPQQVLLDVVGLHPGSVEFQQRYAESATALYNRLRLSGGGSAFLAALIVLAYTQSGLDLLAKFGYVHDGESELPDILEKYFTTQPNLLADALVDDVDLSETARVRPSTTSGDNYLAWLAQAATTSHDALRRQEGFADGVPRALLFHMLRHALDLSYVETSVRLFVDAGLLAASDLVASRREQAFVQVAEASVTGTVAGASASSVSGSRWEPLYQHEAAITGNPALTVGDYIPTQLTTLTATAYLRRQVEALEHLRDLPTAALERCLTEHIDLCTYRLDAWYGGLMSRHLESLRYETSGEGEPPPARTGVHLGAWGYLEQVRPQDRDLAPVELPDDLDAIFNADPAAPPLTRDATNQGYLHAPSLNHAVTAAILRNGYLSNATPANPSSLAVNLSSERVRMALSVIEGLKADQSMGALLGFQFERGLHDRHDVEVDEFIYDLRLQFPLAGNRLTPTRTDATDEAGDPVGISQVEARNVIDGQAFVAHLKAHAQTYPFGLTGLPPANPDQVAAISAEAVRLLDIEDAVADLAMAESVHQVAMGNYERAGAILDTYSKGKFPSTTEVVQTPRSGVTLTHRAALHLPVGLSPTDPARISPRSRAEPAVDVWLADVLPVPTRVACTVTVTDPTGGPDDVHVVTQADLGLAPLDVVHLLDPDEARSTGGLDDLVEAHVIGVHSPRPDATMTIGYRERIATIAGHVPFFELAAMLRPLRDVVLRSRPLRATDLALANESQESHDLDVSLDVLRVELNRDDLADRRDDLEAFGTALQAVLDTEPRPVAQIVTDIDDTVDDFVGHMRGAASFAELRTGTAAVFAERHRIYAGLQRTLADLLARWDQRLADFDQAIADYDADPGASDEAKFQALLTAERHLVTSSTTPLPAQPDDFRDDLVTGTRTDFVAQRAVLAGLGTSQVTVGSLHDGLEAGRPAIALHDPEPLDLAAHVAAAVTLAEDLAGRATGLVAEMTARLDGVQSLLDAHAAEADPRRRVDQLTDALRLLFGDDFPVVPDFGMTAALGAEWRAAWGPGPAPDRGILDHQESTLGRSLPVDEWFTGVARVREKLRSLETVTRLAEAFDTADLGLHPLQFPHRPGVPWLALEFPETLPSGDPLAIDEDKLLYTAHFAVPFDEADRQAGLLVDEWTEVIPRRTEDTGLAFHYDRPNSEPPQTLLLALPADHGEGWRWEDLVDSVRETVDLARKRAIEPDHLDTTAYARFLPAVISAVSLFPIFPALNYSMVNAVASVLDEGGGDG